MRASRDRLLRAAPALVSLGVFLAALAVLQVELRTVTWSDLTRRAAAIPPSRLALALLLTVLNYFALAGYDVLAGEYVGRRVSVGRAGFVYRHGEAVYGFRGLRAFKEHFEPVWAPRYLAYPGRWCLPRLIADTSAIVAGGYRRIFLR